MVERTLAALGRFRRLTVPYERRSEIPLALLDFGFALVCFRTLQRQGFG